MYKRKKNKIYNVLLITFFLAIYLFCWKAPVMANEVCKPFPFTEQWGKTPEEFKESNKTLNLDGFFVSELPGYIISIKYHNEELEIVYIFENNKLSSIGYSLNPENVENAKEFYEKLKNDLKCSFLNEYASTNIKNDIAEVELTGWKKNKTGVFLMYSITYSNIMLEIFDMTNPINKNKIEHLNKIKIYTK